MVKCDDVTADVLGPRVEPVNLGGLFQFGRYGRRFSDVSSLRDCHVTSIYPLELWQEGGVPSVAMFRSLFPRLLAALGDSSPVYVHIKGVELHLFQETSVILSYLRPAKIRYALLPPLADAQRPEDIGNLVFECPPEIAEVVSSNWLIGPWTEVEGYVLAHRDFSRLIDCYFSADSVNNIRSLLSFSSCVFRLWTDTNGMEVFSATRTAERIEGQVRHNGCA